MNDDKLMSKVDLDIIISNAKNNMSNKTFPVYLEECKALNERTTIVPQEHQHIVCIVEATIQHLNKEGLLNIVPKFNYKENKF